MFRNFPPYQHFSYEEEVADPSTRAEGTPARHTAVMLCLGTGDGAKQKMELKSRTTLAKKFISTGLGIAVGLFVGIFILGTMVRLIFSAVFRWGDRAPIWGIWTEGIIIVALTVLSLFFSLKWIKGKKKS